MILILIEIFLINYFSVYIGNHGVPTSIPSQSRPLLQGKRSMPANNSSTPLITSVTSLAPKPKVIVPGTRLIALASQVPSPLARPKSNISGKSSTSPVLPAKAQSVSPGKSRLQSLLDKPVPPIPAQAPNRRKQLPETAPQPMPIILVPPNNANKRKTNPKEASTDHAVCSYIPITPKGQQRVMTQTIQQTKGTASQLVMNMATPTTPSILATPKPYYLVPAKVLTPGTGKESSSTETSPRIESVYSKAGPSRSKVRRLSNPVKEKEVPSPGQNQQFRIVSVGSVPIEGASNSNEDDGGEQEIRIRQGQEIFEMETEPSSSADSELSIADTETVPKIVSTSGGVPLHPKKSVPRVTEAEMDSKLLQAQKQHQLRMSMQAATIAEKAKYPVQKWIGGNEFLGCRTCGKSFPASCQAMYKNHMLTKHAVEMDGDGVQVSKVRGSGQSDWYKCRTCDQLMSAADKESHKATCCPEATEDGAFDLVQICSSKVSNAMPLFCGLCEKSFDSRIGLRQHLTGFHKEVGQKVILDPTLRCSFCLQRFESSVHLTIHCASCDTRRASRDTMLELAKGMIDCEICSKPHKNIQETQECYTKTGLIRCLLCHHTVVSRGNFFHHMKTYHFRNTVGILCPFCDVGTMPIRDCFIHILDKHFTPILEEENIAVPTNRSTPRPKFVVKKPNPVVQSQAQAKEAPPKLIPQQKKAIPISIDSATASNLFQSQKITFTTATGVKNLGTGSFIGRPILISTSGGLGPRFNFRRSDTVNLLPVTVNTQDTGENSKLIFVEDDSILGM